MTPRILLRADGGHRIGLGHIRRVQVLATLFDAAGAQTAFACNADGLAYLAAQGVPSQRLFAPDADWGAPSHIVADINYGGNADRAASEIARLAAGTALVTVIDSMPPDHFVAHPGGAPDLVVTPYLHADRFRPPPACREWLFGGDMAIIDPQYAEMAGHAPSTPPRILVSCGGSDPENLTDTILDVLRPLGHPVDVVVGPLFDQRTRRGFDNVTVHQAPAGLAVLVAQASLVVGRVGLLRYEAASLGRQGVYLQHGPEYRDYLEAFSKAGVAEIFFEQTRFLKRLEDVGPNDFVHNQAAQEAIDGLGAERVAKAILNLKVKE